MSKLQPLFLDNGQIIFVATTPNVVDTSNLPPSSAEPETEMNLPEPVSPELPNPFRTSAISTTSITASPNTSDQIDTPRSKGIVQTVQQVMTTPIALPKLEAPKLDSEALKQAATQTVGDLVQGYTGYLLNSLKAVATTHVGISKVTLEFGVDLELNTGIPYIAASAIGSSVKVTVECDLKQGVISSSSETSV